jgi:hypothetical protein
LEDCRHRSPIFSLNVLVSNKDKGSEQHSVSILNRLIPTEMRTHLDGTGFIVKSKGDRCVSHAASLAWRKKGGNHLRISNFAFQKNRMENERLGITKECADCNGLIGVHGQGTSDQDQPRHADGSKNA